MFRLTTNPTLADDLIQEALAHLWQIQQEHPGQTECWYYTSCKHRIQHCLVTGRSVDSVRRRFEQAEYSEDEIECNRNIDSEINLRDIVSEISRLLPPDSRQVLDYLADGFGACDIANRMGVSHPMIHKHRKKIAKAAMRLDLV